MAKKQDTAETKEPKAQGKEKGEAKEAKTMPLVKIPTGARELDVSIEHARRQIRLGNWPAYKLGKKATRIDVEEIRTLSRLAQLADHAKNPCAE